MNLEALRQALAPLLHATPFADRAWFAGGCVRDYLLHPEGELDGDVDITVELPQGGIKLAEHLQTSWNADKPILHPEFFTASLTWRGLHLEFVATRREVYKPRSRYPLVFPGSLAEDVMRRDITVNSLLMSITTGEIADLSGLGLPDLRQGIVRCLGNPETKFREDSLRLLRALRFALRLDFSLAPETLAAMRSQGRYLNRLSSRLISLEITKLLQHSTPELLHSWLSELGWDSNVRLNNALQKAERERI